MTTISKFLQVLGVAALLAALALSLPTGAGHAAARAISAQTDCERRGYYWDTNTGQCADVWCQGDGRPGEIRVIFGAEFQCNGFTGNWEIIRRAHTPPPTTGLRYPLGQSTPGSLTPDAAHTGPTVSGAAPRRAGVIAQP
jgi:hypothetical protein